MADGAERTEVDPTAGLARRDRHLKIGSARSSIAAQAIVWGLGCGLAGGSVAGTLLVPLYGTLYGAVYGLAIAVVPSVFGAAAILVGAGPTRSRDDYVRRVRTVTAGLGVAVVVVGIPIARTIDDGFGSRSVSWLTTAVAVGLLASLGVLVRATRSLSRLEPPRPAAKGAFSWTVFALSGGAIAAVVGVLAWTHLFTEDAQQRNEAIALRNRAGEVLGIDDFPESSRRVGTSEAPVTGCPPGPISRAEQSADFATEPTKVLDRAATAFAADGWGVVRGSSFVRGDRWMYAERRDRSLLIRHSQGSNGIIVTAVVGCPDGVPSGSTYDFPGGPAPLGPTVRRTDAPAVLVPAGEEVPGREAEPELVSAARVPEERVENRGLDDCSPQEYANPSEELADAGDDRIVVVVAHEVDELRAPADDWVVVRRSGAVVEPSCISAVFGGDGVAFGVGLPSTMLLAGPFEDPDDPVERIELRGPLSTVDPDAGEGYEGLAIDEIAAIDDAPRPVLAFAQPLPGVDPDGTTGRCRDADQTVWVLWDRELFIAYEAADRGAGYQVAFEGSEEVLDVPLDVAKDDVHELCVSSMEPVASITYEAGAVEGVDDAVTIDLDATGD
jgi:hypothetical protein